MPDGLVASARRPPACVAGGVDLDVIWVHCDVDSMYNNLQARGAARDAWKSPTGTTTWPRSTWHFDLDVPHFEVDNGENAAIGLAAQPQRFVSLVRHEQ